MITMQTNLSNDQFLIKLGLLIKQARSDKGISQEELAWRCEITKNGLGKIELGRSNVKITTLTKLFVELNLSLSIIQEIL